jgi:hypothetical protein
MSPAEIKLERRDSIFALRDVGTELKISLSRHPGGGDRMADKRISPANSIWFSSDDPIARSIERLGKPLYACFSIC